MCVENLILHQRLEEERLATFQTYDEPAATSALLYEECQSGDGDEPAATAALDGEGEQHSFDVRRGKETGGEGDASDNGGGVRLEWI